MAIEQSARNTTQKRKAKHEGTLSAVQPVASFEVIACAIRERFQPERIVLFGSHAYGTPHAESDIDLLIVMPYVGSPFRQASLILAHLVQTVGVLPFDLLVRTREQIQERLQMGDPFMQEILERGQTIYEADHRRMGKQGGRRLANCTNELSRA